MQASRSPVKSLFSSLLQFLTCHNISFDLALIKLCCPINQRETIFDLSFLFKLDSVRCAQVIKADME
jgi:hypothetical protein